MTWEEERAYIAGFFDGEGSVSISKKNTKPTPTFGLDCTITNTNRKVLEWIRGVVRMGTIHPKPRTKNQKPCWYLKFDAQEMGDFLAVIVPYLRVRKGQAQLVLEFLETSTYHGPHNPISVEDYALKEVIYEELLLLNKRGG